ncbi:hypothetical protein DYB32_009107 [Aphanomyces invadans]|uniref:S1 motif domain-containing protein n=1 Tax=Aphanomyces invadans TaxID=157072 RepID=A0A3R6VRA6_9STRA|nr:hypothetical protein DYB32_009107 [Aphanomyces invadans]
MVLLVIHWLQVRGVVPYVDVSCSHSLDVSAMDDTIAQAFDDAVVPSDATDGLRPVPELLMDFFVFWASEFPYATRIASLRRDDLVKEGKHANSPILFLEDPIETTRNLGSYLNRDTQRLLRNEMVRVCVLVRQWQIQPPPSLLLQSVLFDDCSLNPQATAVYAPDALHACIVRRRSAHSQSFTMTGDVVFGERSRLKVDVVATNNNDARDVVAMAFRRGIVGLDCEGVALGRTGMICLVSLSVGSRVFLFDILASPSLMQVLKPLLECPSTLKVMHDCRKDSDALFHQFGIVLTNVFDTQVGYAMCQLQRVNKSKEATKCLPVRTLVIPLGNANSECIAFSDLLWQCLSIYEPAKHEVKASMTSATWTVRPLTAQLMHYAAVDVMYLPVLYRVLVKALTADSLALTQKRTTKYLSCREWTYAVPAATDPSSPAVSIGQVVPGFINNVTQKNVYVSISPNVVAAVAISTPTLPIPGDGMSALHVGDAVSMCISSVDASGAVIGEFHSPPLLR